VAAARSPLACHPERSVHRIVPAVHPLQLAPGVALVADFDHQRASQLVLHVKALLMDIRGPAGHFVRERVETGQAEPVPVRARSGSDGLHSPRIGKRCCRDQVDRSCRLAETKIPCHLPDRVERVLSIEAAVARADGSPVSRQF